MDIDVGIFTERMIDNMHHVLLYDEMKEFNEIHSEYGAFIHVNGSIGLEPHYRLVSYYTYEMEFYPLGAVVRSRITNEFYKSIVESSDSQFEINLKLSKLYK